jgi:hypothetical protein
MAQSPHFSLEPAKLPRIVENTFQRSYFGCYGQYASLLSVHVRSSLALEEVDEPAPGRR